MVLEVFPSYSDIGGSGTGRAATESNLLDSFDRLSVQSTILSGMEPSDGGGLTLTIAPGRCRIAGYIVRLTAAENFTLPDDSTGYIWLIITGSIPGAADTSLIRTDDLETPPTAPGALVTKYITSGGSISSVVDRERREGEGMIMGSYAGEGGEDDQQTIDLGLTPRLVYSRSRNFEWPIPRFNFAISNIFPGNVEWPDFDETRQGIPWWLLSSAEDWPGTAETSGGLGIIPDGFIAYNSLSNDVNGMNITGITYDYIAWF